MPSPSASAPDTPFLSLSLPPRLIAIRQTGRRRRQRPGFLRARCLQREEEGHNWRRLRELLPAQPRQPKRVFDALCCRRRLTPATSCGGTCADTTSASSLPPTASHRQTFRRPSLPKTKEGSGQDRWVVMQRRVEGMRYLTPVTPPKTKVHNEFGSWCACKSLLIRTAAYSLSSIIALLLLPSQPQHSS